MSKIVMTQDQFDDLAAILPGDEDGLRPDYSGRGMYGKSCLGYVTDDGPAAFQMAVAELLAKEILGYLDDDDKIDLDIVKEAMAELGQPSYRGIQVEGHENEARF